MAQSFELIKDQSITQEVRYVSVMGQYKRYDFTLIPHAEETNKTLVIDMNKNRYALLEHNDVGSQTEIAHLFQVPELEAEELILFLKKVL